jgi:hypothetical protein
MLRMSRKSLCWISDILRPTNDPTTMDEARTLIDESGKITLHLQFDQALL